MPATKKFVLLPGTTGSVLVFLQDGESPATLNWTNTEAAEEGGALDQNARAVIDALTKANIGKFDVISQELVGPVIGADLQRKGIYATLASIVGITIYIGLRKYSHLRRMVMEFICLYAPKLTSPVVVAALNGRPLS